MSREKTAIIAGASGVVGKYMIARAKKEGFRVRILSASRPSSSQPEYEIYNWDPRAASMNDEQALGELRAALRGSDFLINLAGESIGEGRFTARRKKAILESRIAAVAALARALRGLDNPPRVWAQASAVGYYGDTGEEPAREESPLGKLFLSQVCDGWESEALDAARELPDMRMFIMRLGLVLSPEAPAWKKMLLPIKMGAGGPLGSGRQWYSWIDAEDLVRAAFFLAEKKDATGAYNFTSPEPVRQKEMAALAAGILRRPCFLPTPAPILRLALGQMADELLLASCRALPERLLEAGFTFDRPGIREECMFLLKGAPA